jgi:hypothetical protein
MCESGHCTHQASYDNLIAYCESLSSLASIGPAALAETVISGAVDQDMAESADGERAELARAAFAEARQLPAFGLTMLHLASQMMAGNEWGGCQETTVAELMVQAFTEGVLGIALEQAA